MNSTDSENRPPRVEDQTWIDPDAAALARRIERREAARKRAARRKRFAPTVAGLVVILILLVGIGTGLLVNHSYDPPAPPCEKAGWVLVTPKPGEGFISLIERTTKDFNEAPNGVLLERAIAKNGGSDVVKGRVWIQKSCDE